MVKITNLQQLKQLRAHDIKKGIPIGNKTALSNEQEAKRWLLNKIQNIRLSGVTSLDPGGMYMYYYDPKTKDKLPYYDRFPLVLVVEFLSDGFYGLNLHYLPPSMRKALLTKLLTLANNRLYNDTTRLIMSYQLSAGTRRYKEFAPTFKRYLYSHVQTKFVPIDIREWDLAINLPTAKFTKKGTGTVWKDSRSMIK